MNKSLDAIMHEIDATPCLIMDLKQVEKNWHAFQNAFNAKIYYAVKANPAEPILKTLVSLGAYFDAASLEEIHLCLKSSAKPHQISYGNPVKRIQEIQKAFGLGIELYAVDSKEEIQKIAKYAPNSSIYCRIAVPNTGADWPLAKKFGARPEDAWNLLEYGMTLGLKPRGVSFHVGSQQLDPNAYVGAIQLASTTYKIGMERGVILDLLNIGGGFPISYHEQVPCLNDYSTCIEKTIEECFIHRPSIMIEPGRAIVGNAGTIVCEILLISQRDPNDPIHWAYIDIGRFGGLAETEGEMIKYPIKTFKKNDGLIEVKIAGPTCDGVDVLYDKTIYRLPKNLTSGDRLIIENTGAYTWTYASQCFNGFEPPHILFI